MCRISIISIFLCLLSIQAIATLGPAEGSSLAGICDDNFTGGAVDSSYEQLAHQLIETLEWKNEVRPNPARLAMLLGYKKISDTSGWTSGEVVDLFEALPGLPDTKSFEVSEPGAANFQFKYTNKRTGKDQYPTFSVSNKLNEDDLRLINLSFRGHLPKETAHFRFHFDESGDNFYTTKDIIGDHFSVRMPGSERLANSILKRIRQFKRRGQEVVEVELVHTHPYESLIFRTIEGSIDKQILNLLSYDSQRLTGDLFMVIDLQEELRKAVQTKITAIVGVEPTKTYRITYYPRMNP